MMLLVVAVFDGRWSRLPQDVQVLREIKGRMQIGVESEVAISLANHATRAFTLRIKDEYPPEMMLKGLREARLRD
ncbi:MAG: hypothetical protein WKF84_11830 [Pyrinomonadaceae bacterium]